MKIEIEITEETAALLFLNYSGRKTIEEIVLLLIRDCEESYRRLFPHGVDDSVEAFRVASLGR